MQTKPTTYTDDGTRRRTRRGLSIYFAIVVALSLVVEGFIISNPELDGLIARLMLVPTLTSVVARFVLKEGFSDVSFRFGGRRGRNDPHLSGRVNTAGREHPEVDRKPRRRQT
jgi:hypothetical protein